MKRHRHTPEQAVRKLGEGERLLNEGKDLAEVSRHLEIAESTWNRWRNQYGGMEASGAKRLKTLKVENARLKKLLAHAELDKAILKGLAEGKWWPRIVLAAPWWSGSRFPSAGRVGWWVNTVLPNADRHDRSRLSMRSYGVGSASSRT